MESPDIKDESLEEIIQAMKQLIARTERQLAHGCNTACKDRSDAKNLLGKRRPNHAWRPTNASRHV